ncbi:MAG: MFS transporter [Eubacteriaceae bacterium]|nr:MFS transporter [Eubacteriaceae bacterium]
MQEAKEKSFGKFIALWAADFYANIASGLTAFALGIYMFEMSGTATSVALTVLFAFLPTMLLNPVAGVLADRFDRRLMMLIGDGCSALGLIYILFCITSGHVSEWQVYLGVGINSVFIALLEPAFKATITDLLTKEQFAKASGLVQIAGSAKFLLSPFIAGFLLTFTDIKAILIIDITTIAVTMPVTMFVKKQIAADNTQHGNQGFFEDFADGWREVSSNKGLLLMIAIISLVTFYMGFLQTLYTPLMLTITDAKTLGIIESVSAVGMLASSILLGMFTLTRSYVNQLVTGLVFSGVFIALLGFTTNIYIITCSGFLFFACLPFINTSADVLARSNIPDEKQGRVWGLIGILSQFGYVVAYAVSGLLADRVFNPLLMESGILASSLGRIIGVGSGRGIGLLLIVSGIMLVVLALILGKVHAIRELERSA